MESRLISRNDFQKLHGAFCHAFSNYRVDFNLTEDEFDTRVHKKLAIDYNLSAATFDGEEMIGFILHTSNIYEGIPTAFNGGTGVIPGFRNQRTGEDLYEFLLPKIIEKSLARILLEVIDTNEQAIRLYEKMGFTFRRKFLCYKLENSSFFSGIEGTATEGTNLHINEDFADFEPSFVDSKNQLMKGNETVLIIEHENEVAGYAVFQPMLGRISQIAISRQHRKKGLGKKLIKGILNRSQKKLTIINVPEDEYGFQQFLLTCGFENQVNQFEMELII
ncbi:MAG: GNAT family N-acetyltransferase [Cyclobacteriaceae bacterium]